MPLLELSRILFADVCTVFVRISCSWGIDPVMAAPQLKPWIMSWVREGTVFLTPEDSFLRGRGLDRGSYEEGILDY